MDFVGTAFWTVIAVLAGFLASYSILKRDAGASAAILASFWALGMLVNVLMGYPTMPYVSIYLALSVGFGWGAWEWERVQRVCEPALPNFLVWCVNYVRRATIAFVREPWSERLARWGFPNHIRTR